MECWIPVQTTNNAKHKLALMYMSVGTLPVDNTALHAYILVLQWTALRHLLLQLLADEKQHPGFCVCTGKICTDTAQGILSLISANHATKPSIWHHDILASNMIKRKSKLHGGLLIVRHCMPTDSIQVEHRLHTEQQMWCMGKCDFSNSCVCAKHQEPASMACNHLSRQACAASVCHSPASLLWSESSLSRDTSCA